jgi:hypothetical protein
MDGSLDAAPGSGPIRLWYARRRTREAGDRILCGRVLCFFPSLRALGQDTSDEREENLARNAGKGRMKILAETGRIAQHKKKKY